MHSWLELIHSDWQDHLGLKPPGDRLDDPAWLAQFLSEAKLGRLPSGRRALVEDLKRLRADIRRAVEDVLADGVISDASRRRINGHLATPAVHPALERSGSTVCMRLRPAGDRQAAIVFGIAASFAEFLTTGDVGRLRACDNPTCGWVFLDATRSRTGRWCGPTCRSLIKVRELRRREKRSGRRLQKRTRS